MLEENERDIWHRMAGAMDETVDAGLKEPRLRVRQYGYSGMRVHSLPVMDLDCLLLSDSSLYFAMAMADVFTRHARALWMLGISRTDNITFLFRWRHRCSFRSGPLLAPNDNGLNLKNTGKL